MLENIKIYGKKEAEGNLLPCVFPITNIFSPITITSNSASFSLTYPENFAWPGVSNPAVWICPKDNIVLKTVVFTINVLTALGRANAILSINSSNINIPLSSSTGIIDISFSPQQTLAKNDFVYINIALSSGSYQPLCMTAQMSYVDN